jgi:hypothetical protein
MFFLAFGWRQGNACSLSFLKQSSCRRFARYLFRGSRDSSQIDCDFVCHDGTFQSHAFSSSERKDHRAHE